MRYLLFFLLLNTSNLLAQAPSYQNFEWDIIQLGYTNSAKLTPVNSGFLLGSEIRYNFRDDFSVGIGSDFAFYFDKLTDKNADIFTVSSGVILIDKYLRMNSNKRAFFGFGLGEHVSRKLLVRENEETEVLDKFSSFGVSARIGYELNRLRFKAQYNFTTQEGMSDYLTLKVGFTLWGKYKGR